MWSFIPKIKFEKLVHLVGFIIRMYISQCNQRVDQDSSVGIVTLYGLNDPGIESRRGRDFPRLSKPALGPTQPPIQWVLGLSWG